MKNAARPAASNGAPILRFYRSSRLRSFFLSLDMISFLENAGFLRRAGLLHGLSLASLRVNLDRDSQVTCSPRRIFIQADV